MAKRLEKPPPGQRVLDSKVTRPAPPPPPPPTTTVPDTTTLQRYLPLIHAGDRTGYMDVVLHQLYLFEPFRRLVLDQPKQPPNSSPETRVFGCLQDLFVALQQKDSNDEEEIQQPSVTTAAAALVDGCEEVLELGHAIRQPNDASEFTDKFLDVLDRALIKMGHNVGLQSLLGGTLSRRQMCRACGHVIKGRPQKFFALDVEVRGHTTLEAALAKGVFASEEMTGLNKLRCANCQNQTEHVLSSPVTQLPRLLSINLKRIDLDYATFDTVKLNSRLSFPERLDLSAYYQDDDDNNNTVPSTNAATCRLKGVINHTGTAQGGHYYSLVRLPEENNCWLKILPDQHVEWFDFDKNVERECYGGKIWVETKWPNGQMWRHEKELHCNAFMLSYERDEGNPN